MATRGRQRKWTDHILRRKSLHHSEKNGWQESEGKTMPYTARLRGESVLRIENCILPVKQHTSKYTVGLDEYRKLKKENPLSRGAALFGV